MFNNFMVSIGVVIYFKDVIILLELICCVDKVMYVVKYGGKNQYCYYYDVVFFLVVEIVLGSQFVEVFNVILLKKVY